MIEAKYVKEFTPNWFAVTMGTGGTALVLNHFIERFPLLHDIATGMWLFNIFLFVCCSVLFTTRFICYPQHFRLMLSHSVQSLFLGCIPMGLITIVNGFIA